MPLSLETQTLTDLYNQDLSLWLQMTIDHLRDQNWQQIDRDHLIEELEGLAGRDKRDLENRLDVLLTHLLKRMYVHSPENYRGWELTIREQRKQIQRLLKQSPSLKNYLTEVFPEVWQTARSEVSQDYPHSNLPTLWPHGDSIEVLLSQLFW
jgi:hypothetical protein